MERNEEGLGNLLQRLFDRAPDGLVVTRLRDGLIVLANEAIGRLLGYEISEMVGRRAEEFSLWPGAVERGEMERARGPLEWKLTTRDGRALELEITAEVVDIGGELHAFAIAREMTARNQAQRDLRESEERFRSLVQNSRDGILVTNASGRLTYVSPGAAAILGEPAEVLMGRSERELIHPHDVQVRDRSLAGSNEDVSPQPMAELRMKHRDGTWRWVETVDANRLKDPAVLGTITNFRDVTQRKRWARQWPFERCTTR